MQTKLGKRERKRTLKWFDVRVWDRYAKQRPGLINDADGSRSYLTAGVLLREGAQSLTTALTLLTTTPVLGDRARVPESKLTQFIVYSCVASTPTQ